MRRLPKYRRPTHPGEILLEDFLRPLGISQKKAAERLRISYPRMNEIINGKRSVTPETASSPKKSSREGALRIPSLSKTSSHLGSPVASLSTSFPPQTLESILIRSTRPAPCA